MIAVTEAYRAGLFNKHQFFPNIVAGLVVGVVALPLSMAFAIASGARPEQGLYTAIVAGLCVSLLGGSRLQIAGPTGAFIAILAGITASYGIEGLQFATLMAGCMLVLMGVFRMGNLIRFIPAPVIIGFTTGIGVIIFVGQWPYFLGLPTLKGVSFTDKLIQTLGSLHLLNLPTLILAVTSLAVLIVMPRLKGLARIPPTIIALIGATVAQSIFAFDGVATIGNTFGGIPQGLPSFQLPEVSFNQALLLIGPAFTIAMLGSIESLLSAVVADRMAQTRHQPNQELIGQGIANIVVPFFGGFAATGAIARTATNIKNGGTSPLAGVVHVLTLVGVLVVLAPLAQHIPLACLSAILFVVAWNMSELHRFKAILFNAPNAERLVLVVTFLLTVFVDLVVAVNVGVILAILHFLSRMSQTVSVKINADIALPPGWVLYKVDGPLFFATAVAIESVQHTIPKETQTSVLDLTHTLIIDVTALQALEDLIQTLKKRSIRVILIGARPRVYKKLKQYGVFKLIQDEDYLDDLSKLPKP
jgi:sulfate permease, SulP family